MTVNLVVDDHAGRACLTQLGFQEREGEDAVMKRDLDHIPEPTPPPGFLIRPVAGDHEAPLLAEVHNSAFHPKWTAARYLDVIRCDGFDAGRELVMVAPDGRFAAFAVVWFDPVSRVGLFEPVGCHPDFRRRGLTKALLYAGCARMRAAGMAMATVGYGVSNAAAVGLYKSAGFEIYFETIDYVLDA